MGNCHALIGLDVKYWFELEWIYRHIRTTTGGLISEEISPPNFFKSEVN